MLNSKEVCLNCGCCCLTFVLIIIHLSLALTQYEHLEFDDNFLYEDYFKMLRDEWMGSAVYDITVNSTECAWP